MMLDGKMFYFTSADSIRQLLEVLLTWRRKRRNNGGEKVIREKGRKEIKV
jgi:hypothetical protein